MRQTWHPSPLPTAISQAPCRPADLNFHLLLAVRSEKFLRPSGASSLPSLLNFLSRMSQQTYVATSVLTGKSSNGTSFARTVF